MANTGSGQTAKSFDPTKYLEEGGDGPYLPLKWQLAWLRQEHPKAEIRTKLMSRKDSTAVFWAEIKLPDGGLSTGWGAKTKEDVEDLDQSYITEAENQALVRALAVLGYGIEYARDFDPPLETHIILPDSGDYEVETEEEASIEVPSILLELEIEEEEAVPEPLRLSEVRASFQEERPRVQIVTPPAEEAPKPTPIRPPVSNAPQITNPSVEEKLRGVEDSQLRINIKAIYKEAKSRGYSEETVDQRSQKRFNKPTYELTLEEAEDFLEKIKNSRPQNAKTN